MPALDQLDQTQMKSGHLLRVWSPDQDQPILEVADAESEHRIIYPGVGGSIPPPATFMTYR